MPKNLHTNKHTVTWQNWKNSPETLNILGFFVALAGRGAGPHVPIRIQQYVVQNKNMIMFFGLFEYNIYEVITKDVNFSFYLLGECDGNIFTSSKRW